MSFCIPEGRWRIIINSDVLRHLPIIHLFFSLVGFRSRLLVTDLKLNQKDILCEGIGIGDRSTRASPLVVAKLVIDRDLTLDLGRKILEVVVESHDGARVQIIAQVVLGSNCSYITTGSKFWRGPSEIKYFPRTYHVRR